MYVNLKTYPYYKDGIISIHKFLSFLVIKPMKKGLKLRKYKKNTLLYIDVLDEDGKVIAHYRILF